MKLSSKIILLLGVLIPVVVQASENVQFSPDEDNNGVRDDIDEYIQINHDGNEKLKLFLTDYARLFQEIVMNHEDKNKLINQFDRLSIMARCLVKLLPENARNIMTDLEIKILNTIDLHKAYNKSNGKMNGQITRWSPLNPEECAPYFEFSD